MRSRSMCAGLLSAIAFVIVISLPVAAGYVELAGTKVEFQVPDGINAYDPVPIDLKMSGTGDAAVQIVATDSASYERFFDTAIPHKVAFRIDYLSENDGRATFRMTNTGDTIWKVGGQGGVRIASYSDHATPLESDVAPGESVTKTLRVERLRSRSGSEGDRSFVLRFSRSNPLKRASGTSEMQVVIPDCKPGSTGSAEITCNPIALLDDFDELGHNIVRRILADKPVTVQTKLQVPPWADRLVVRLIKDGAIITASVPIKVSQESLKLGGKPNTRWTLNGKPIFIVENMQAHEVPQLRERLGGDNVVLAYDTILGGSDAYINAARANGYKIMPVSIAYVRLQLIGQWTNHKLMPGISGQNGSQRVDALDPDFHIAMADMVDKYMTE